MQKSGQLAYMLQGVQAVFSILDVLPFELFGKKLFRERMRKREADKPVMFHAVILIRKRGILVMLLETREKAETQSFIARLQSKIDLVISFRLLRNPSIFMAVHLIATKPYYMILTPKSFVHYPLYKYYLLFQLLAWLK